MPSKASTTFYISEIPEDHIVTHVRSQVKSLKAPAVGSQGWPMRRAQGRGRQRAASFHEFGASR